MLQIQIKSANSKKIVRDSFSNKTISLLFPLICGSKLSNEHVLTRSFVHFFVFFRIFYIKIAVNDDKGPCRKGKVILFRQPSRTESIEKSRHLQRVKPDCGLREYQVRLWTLSQKKHPEEV